MVKTLPECFRYLKCSKTFHYGIGLNSLLRLIKNHPKTKIQDDLNLKGTRNRNLLGSSLGFGLAKNVEYVNTSLKILPNFDEAF